MGGLHTRRIHRSSQEYPALLKEISDPPLALNVSGRSLEPGPAIAVVGTRKPTPYGLKVARSFSEELAGAGLTIVSGMARGIDASAHRGALESGGATVAVLGSGLDVCYPQTNRALYEELVEKGTLVSEYEEGTPPLPHHFPTRNRIISGMSLGVLIVEGKSDGGAMITARLALESSREVFAVPGPVHSSMSAGPHLLLRDGARIVTSPSDVLEELGLEGQLSLNMDERARELSLTPDEARLMDHLGGEVKLLDLLASSLKMPVSTVSAILCRLEIKGVVSRHPGGRFGAAPL
jgi:DNA processing protein